MWTPSTGRPEWKTEAAHQQAALPEIAHSLAPGRGHAAAERARARRRARRPSPRLPAAPARGAALAGARCWRGRKLTFDRGVAGAVRCGGARASRCVFRSGAGRSRRGAARRRSAGRSLRCLPAPLHHSRRSAVAVFDRAIAECRAGLCSTSRSRRRELHGRVRQRQAVERLQLVPGQQPQPDPGQHRPADLHRSGRRSGVSRGLSGTPRLQRVARAAPRARSRLGRVHGVPAVLAAVAHRRRHRQLRHRRGVSRRRADCVRARRALSAGWPRSVAGRGERADTATDRSACVCAQRGGAALPERRAHARSRRSPGWLATR